MIRNRENTRLPDALDCLFANSKGTRIHEANHISHSANLCRGGWMLLDFSRQIECELTELFSVPLSHCRPPESPYGVVEVCSFCDKSAMTFAS